MNNEVYTTVIKLNAEEAQNNLKKLEDKISELKKKKEEAFSKEEVVTIKEKRWWELPMKKTLFKTEKYKGKFYGQYEGWSENVWIGPYDTEKQLNDVIKSYVEETKKPVMDRNIENVHSIVLKIKEITL